MHISGDMQISVQPKFALYTWATAQSLCPKTD